MWVLHFQIGLSPNYFQPRLNGFRRSLCVGIASYKATLKMKYLHPRVDHSNGKLKEFITTNYASNF